MLQQVPGEVRQAWSTSRDGEKWETVPRREVGNGKGWKAQGIFCCLLALPGSLPNDPIPKGSPPEGTDPSQVPGAETQQGMKGQELAQQNPVVDMELEHGMNGVWVHGMGYSNAGESMDSRTAPSG